MEFKKKRVENQYRKTGIAGQITVLCVGTMATPGIGICDIWIFLHCCCSFTCNFSFIMINTCYFTMSYVRPYQYISQRCDSYTHEALDLPNLCMEMNTQVEGMAEMTNKF